MDIVCAGRPLAGVLFAFANFAGHAQSTFYLGMVLGLYTLGHWAVKAGEWRADRAEAIALHFHASLP